MNRPHVPFGLLALVTLAILFFEYQIIGGRVDALTSARAASQAKRDELTQRTARLRALKGELPRCQEAFEQFLGAYTDAPLEPAQFGALYALNATIKPHESGQQPGVQPVYNRTPAPGARPQAGQLTWTYDFACTSTEFHRFLPALAETENSLPLLRFTKLTLTSPQEPFFTEATALNITGTVATLREGAVLRQGAVTAKR